MSSGSKSENLCRDVSFRANVFSISEVSEKSNASNSCFWRYGIKRGSPITLANCFSTISISVCPGFSKGNS